MRPLAALIAAALVATAALADDPPPPRPKIGLALGGGGARGGAHVGVLKVLERLHIPVDYVAGTSMGAIVGGLYAAGVPLETIEEELRGTDWSDLLADRPVYRDLVWRRKQDEGRYLLDLELGLRDWKLHVPSGLRAGQKLGFKLQTLLLPVQQVHDFSLLPLPFACVATDVETGDRVVLDHGDLAQSILASMTIPGAFAPVEIDGKLLVDGGMADNLPVEVVRAMGADIVIAVNVGTPLAKREALASFVGVTGQAFGFLTVRNAERSAALADVVIRPDLSGVDSGDFGSVGEAITRGEAAAAEAEQALAKLSSDAWDPARRRQPDFSSFPLAFVRAEGNQRVDSRVILARAGLQEGEPFQIPRVRLALRRVFGTSDFQWVRFGLDKEEEGTGVVFRVKEKPWGPTYIHFGLELVDDLEGDADYVVKANLTRTNLNRRGGEWRNDIQAGSHPGWRTELYQPLDFRGHFFVAPWAVRVRSRAPIFQDGNRIASYTVDENLVQLDGGIEYGRWGEVRLGVYRSRVHAEVDTGPPALPTLDVGGGGVAFDVGFDNLDRPAIPRHGSQARVHSIFSRTSLGAEESYDRVELVASHFRGRGRHTGFAVLQYGTSLGSELPAYDSFVLGGLFSLGGYSEGELRGQVLAGLSTGYHFRLSNLPSGLGQGVYLGAELDAANVWDNTSEVSVSDLLYGVTVLVGADTLVGPVFLAYGWAEGGHDRLYLTVGRSF